MTDQTQDVKLNTRGTADPAPTTKDATRASKSTEAETPVKLNTRGTPDPAPTTKDATRASIEAETQERAR